MRLEAAPDVFRIRPSAPDIELLTSGIPGACAHDVTLLENPSRSSVEHPNVVNSNISDIDPPP
jgi:hypothetical protein